ncbi:MAG: Na(+)-translocating NADH-quinone reductase subunit A [Saprospiraceae bacterium]|nr:Na(+)-translocating NADH-quinone reductase subunit A [Saprospiraceae bacterium]
MGKSIRIRRGYDIRLEGSAEKTSSALPLSDVIALKPSDFPSFLPKVLVSPGEEILAGQPVFFDKDRPNLRICSPVSGEVAEVVRGEKRQILEVRIIPDRETTRYLEFPKQDPAGVSRGDLLQRLLDSGVWNYIRQRPYGLIADPADVPKSIFVSCFDSAPLAPSLGFVVGQEPENFQAGLQALQVLANGQLHLGLRADPADADLDESVLRGIPPEHIHRFSGPHPAGNVGIQIHHISPIQKGEVVWVVHPQDVLVIGRLFREGRYRAQRTIALTGSCVARPQYFQMLAGQRISDLTGARLQADHCRIIQGNVLTGNRSSADDFLSFYTNQVTVIPEGDQPEFLGWLLPGFKKLSLSRTYFSWLAPNRVYRLDTNTHGEERAFVMTGQYDKVLPMDIFPVHLLKAILARDIERMEQLGIYEIAEEDFALCEFVCTSKIEVQKIVAEGLDYIRKEG